MPALLKLAGLQLKDGAPSPEERELADRIIEDQLDLLAEAEHDGWMDWHLLNGWSPPPAEGAAARDDSRLIHNLLVPYAELPSEKERDKDRNSVRKFPQLAALAGMKVVPIRWGSRPSDERAAGTC
jgi:hypothetical protein